MDKFLSQQDELGKWIQDRSSVLYQKLTSLDVESLGLPEHCLYYYNASHAKRLFFSIETSAHLLYRSIKMKGKPTGDLIVMDYGAGVGTLYLLAKMIGCRQVIYNDHLEDWKRSAQLIAEAIDVKIDQYIVGDIDECLNRLDVLHIKLDIVTSRNVIEHIYKLDFFYAYLNKRQPQALIFSSTTANRKNPASLIKHLLWHKKWEKIYRGKRMLMIQRQAPGLSYKKYMLLAKATRGLAISDLEKAIEGYRMTGQIPHPSQYHSNTCDPTTGVWAEHLLSHNEYKKLIDENRFDVSFAPGFWDTHYGNRLLNKAARFLNKIISSGKKWTIQLSPFIYVIASPK